MLTPILRDLGILRLILFGFVMIPSILIAQDIANWKSLDATPVALTGANTVNPIFGDGNDSSAQQATITSLFGTVTSPAAVSLNIGESLTVTAMLTLSGGVDGINQYRFGIFNDGGQFLADDRNNWTGGFLHSIGNVIFQARTDGAFVSTGGNATALSAVGDIEGTFNPDSTEPYLLSMTISRDSSTTVDILSRISGGDGAYSQELLLENHPTDLFTFTAFGFLAGGNTSLDQGSLADVSFTSGPIVSNLDFVIREFIYTATDGRAELRISGPAGARCQLVEAADLNFSDPDTNPLTVIQVTTGTLDGNVVILNDEGEADVTIDLGTSNPASFLRVEESL